jgi:hypothetical protein
MVPTRNLSAVHDGSLLLMLKSRGYRHQWMPTKWIIVVPTWNLNVIHKVGQPGPLIRMLCSLQHWFNWFMKWIVMEPRGDQRKRELTASLQSNSYSELTSSLRKPKTHNRSKQCGWRGSRRWYFHLDRGAKTVNHHPHYGDHPPGGGEVTDVAKRMVLASLHGGSPNSGRPGNPYLGKMSSLVMGYSSVACVGSPSSESRDREHCGCGRREYKGLKPP